MSRTEIYAALEEIFNDVLGPSGVALTDAVTAEDIEEWDSITHIDLITAVEKHFKIRFNVRDVQRLPDVGALVDLIESKLNA